MIGIMNMILTTKIGTITMMDIITTMIIIVIPIMMCTYMYNIFIYIYILYNWGALRLLWPVSL